MKTCSACVAEKPRTEFNRDKSQKDGHNHICRPCQSIRYRTYYYANREREQARGRAGHYAYRSTRSRLLRSVKLTCGCIDCGYREEAARLHFDHREGADKLFNPSDGVKRPWSVLLEEIAKCDVRCCGCYARRHAGARATSGASGNARSTLVSS
jgi:hypothetical protein